MLQIKMTALEQLKWKDGMAKYIKRPLSLDFEKALAICGAVPYIDKNSKERFKIEGKKRRKISLMDKDGNILYIHFIKGWKVIENHDKIENGPPYVIILYLTNPLGDRSFKVVSDSMAKKKIIIKRSGAQPAFFAANGKARSKI